MYLLPPYSSWAHYEINSPIPCLWCPTTRGSTVSKWIGHCLKPDVFAFNKWPLLSPFFPVSNEATLSVFPLMKLILLRRPTLNVPFNSNQQRKWGRTSNLFPLFQTFFPSWQRFQNSYFITEHFTTLSVTMATYRNNNNRIIKIATITIGS